MSENKKEITLDVKNGELFTDYYKENPCNIGYTYIRFEVTGNIRSCCIARYPIGSAQEKDWREVWHSGAYENFRNKMSRINVDQFHVNDPEWTFCQQCSHLPNNMDSNNLKNIKRD